MLHNKTVKMNMSVFEGKFARISTKMFALDRQKKAFATTEYCKPSVTRHSNKTSTHAQFDNLVSYIRLCCAHSWPSNAAVLFHSDLYNVVVVIFPQTHSILHPL